MTIFWHRNNWPSNGYSISHLTQHLLLHYLGKTEQTKYALKWTTNVKKLEIASHKILITAVWTQSTSFTYLLQYFLLSNVSLVTRSCFSSRAHQRIGSWSNQTVGVRNVRLHLSRSAIPNSPDLNSVDYKLRRSCNSRSIRQLSRMWITQEATGWNLDWSGAEHYWHCYQQMEKTSACLCSREGPIFETFTVGSWTTGQLDKLSARVTEM